MLFISLFGLSFGSSVYLNKNILCPEDFKGDLICDPGCMQIESNFDSAKLLKNPEEMILRSDCYNNCTSLGCNLDLLNNDVCDDECNNIFCGWDAGECGYCNSNCTISLLANNQPDDECNTKYCLYDNEQFGWCAPGCFYSDFVSNEIKSACNVSECSYQNQIALYNYMPGRCNQVLLENGFCDDICDNEEFDYDNGDCLCAPGCLPEILEGGDCSLDNPCANENCNYVGGKCFKCDDACFESNVGDGTCQSECNTEKCQYDGGDCGCAIGCNSTYINGEWNMIGDCEFACLVPSCLFNYKVCNDLELLSVAIMYSFVFTTYSDPFEIKNAENCSLDVLKSFSKDDGLETTSFCYNENCLYCSGFVKSTQADCERFGNNRCFLYNSTNYFSIFGYATDIINPIKNTSTTVPKLNELMNGLIYFVKEGSFSKQSPNVITVSNDLSFYEAMYINFSPYTTIRFGEGTFPLNFTDKSYIYQDYLSDNASPLYKYFGYKFYELTIEGVGPDKTIVEFLDNIAIEVSYETLYLQNLTFTGAFLLDNNCKSPTCYYCPYYSVTISKVWVNDRDEIIDDPSKYAINCGEGSRTQFVFENDAYISNVVFNNFQNQAPNLINSNGILSFKDVIFEKIQQKELTATIVQTCTYSSCFYKSLTFENVQVIDLNYGYEHIDTTYQSYFLKTSQIGNILFKNVTFEYGMSISCIDCNSAALLIFENVQGTIQILDCEFKNMYITKLIEIITDNLVYSTEAMAQIEKSKQKIYSMDHLFINNTNFHNIYAQAGLIFYNMQNIKQNIKISFSQFKKIVALNAALIQVKGTTSISKIEAYGRDTYIISEKGRSKIEISPRIIYLFELDIENISSGINIIEFENAPNIKLEEIRVKNIKNIDEDDSYNYVIKNFVEGGKYLSVRPESSLVEDIDLQSLFFSYFTHSVIIKGLSVIDIKSTLYSFSVLYVEQCLFQLEIRNINMSNVSTESYSGSLLNAYYINDFIASNLNFEDISNENFSILNLVNILSLSVVDVSLRNLNSNLKAIISITNIQTVILNNFKVININSKVSKGTLFDIFLAPIPDILEISNIIISDSHNESGRGLLLFLDTISPNQPIDFSIYDVSITNSTSNDGLIHFDFNVNFKSAIIKNLNIFNCSSDESIISDFHNKGLLKFENLEINLIQATICAIKGNYIIIDYLLTISNSEIKNCECRNIFFIEGFDKGIVSLQNLTIYNVSCPNSDLILLVYSTLILKNVHFSLLTGKYLIYSMISETEISESVFEDIYSDGFFLLFSSIQSNNCVFKNFDGLVVSLNQNSNSSINNSLFQGIDSETQSFLYSSRNGYSIFFNCTFQDSYSLSSNLYFENSYVVFDYCKVNDNKSKLGTFFQFNTAQLFIHHSIFFNQPYNFIDGSSGFIYIENTKFFQNITNMLDITGNLTENRQAVNEILNGVPRSGLKLLSLYISIQSSSFNEFYGDIGAVIFSQGSHINIIDSTFVNCANSELSSGIIDQSGGGTLKVENSLFSSSLTETSFIKVQKTTVEIINSTFENNANYNGSALYLEGSEGIVYDAFIGSCYFYNNNASVYGGGIYSKGVNLNIFSSRFEFNRADKKGGGIYFDVGDCKKCKLKFSGNSSFIYNSSPNGSGGAIKWLGTPPEIVGNVAYLNNSALYGSDNAAYPVKLKFGSKRELIGIDNFKPGGIYKDIFTVCLADEYNNVVNSEDFDGVQGYLIKSVEFVVSEKSSFTASNGCFDLQDFSVSGDVGKIGKIFFYCKLIEDLSNKYELLESQANAYLNISITLRNCSYGEQNLFTECAFCKASKYLIDSAESCFDCPTGAECLGGFLVLPKKGYWKYDRFSNQIYKCPVAEACQGSKNITEFYDTADLSIDDNSIDYTGTCLTGYKGNLCGSCELGYSKSSNGKCSKCPNPSVNILIITLFLVLIVLVAYIMVTSTLKSAFSVKSLHSIYIKIFTNYLQIIFLTTEFKMNWPSYVLELFSIQRSAASASDQLYSIDCFFTEKSDGSTDIYFYIMFLAVLLPLIIWLISFLIWLFISFYKENIHYLKQEVYTTIIVLFFLIHPNIVKTIFSSFSCMEIQRSGHWLNENLQIRCWTAFHYKIILTMSLPGVILWVFGVPLVILVVMIKRFRFLGKDQNKVIFGFIYNGYKRRNFFWEFVILYRKILIISISVFMTETSTSIQALTVVILLLAALYLQFSQHPYTHKQLNFMETQALFTATLTIYCGLYYINAGLNEPVKNVLFIMIILGNAYFIIFWTYYMFQAIVEILVKMFPLVKKYLKRGDYFEKAIFEESLQMKGVFVNKSESTKNFTFFKPLSSKLVNALEGVKNMNDLYLANMKIKSKKEAASFDLSFNS